MIYPRLLFQGSLTECIRWAGLAKKLARRAYAAGVISKVWKVAEGVTVRVENNLSAKICKVWISVASGGLWYQFITTGESSIVDGNGYFQGSAVAVKLPKISEEGVALLDDLRPIATGSTIEELPNGTTPEDSVMSSIQRIKLLYQVDLATEPSGYFFKSLDNENKYQQLMYSWSSRPGMIYNAGALSPTPTFAFGDIGYDLDPATINGHRASSRAPDTDWPHDATLVKVISEDFGTRTFIVMVDASSRFYCWPHRYDAGDDGLSADYAEQNQKVNVSPDQVQSLIPPFPEWVYVPEGQRRDTDWPSTVNSGEPRYVWRFHPQGLRVVGVVLNRETFTGDAWAQDVTYSSGSTHFENTSEILEDWDFSTDDIHSVDYTGSPKNDSPGYVEFSLDIVLTGEEDNDFTFDLTLLQDQPADATHYIIAADYLSPVLKGWDTYSIDANPGDLIILSLEVLIGPINQSLLVCENFVDTPSEYFRQVWAKVIHSSTETVLRQFLILDKPDDYIHVGTYVDSPEQFIIFGALSGIDLSKLAFMYQVRYQKFWMDTDDYYTEEYDTFAGLWFGIRQRWVEEEIGMRLYVFNQVAKEVRAGEEFDAWDTVDAVEVSTESTVLSPIERGRKAFFKAAGGAAEDILNRLYMTPFAYQVQEIYSNPPLVYTTTSYVLLDPDNMTDLEYAVYNGFWSSINNTQLPTDGVDHKTYILEQLALINDRYDVEFIETYVYPYVKRMLVQVLDQIDHLELIEDIEHAGAYLPFIVWKPEYGSVSFPNGFDKFLPGNYSYSHFNAYYFYHYRPYKKSKYLSGFSYTPIVGKPFATPWFYDYPVGSDSYLNAWFNAVKASINETLCCSPEGFFAATHELFYATQALPDVSAYTVGYEWEGDDPLEDGQFTGDFKKDRYFVGRGWGKFPDPVVIPQNAKYSLVNQPGSACLSNFKLDVVGHISGSQTTHQALYEAAYQHTVTFPESEIEVTVPTFSGSEYRYYYIYKASFVVNGETFLVSVEPSYPELQTEVLRFPYRPLLNGCALFSK